MTKLQDSVDALIQTTAALGQAGLLIAENEKETNTAMDKGRNILVEAGYKEAGDYLEVMDLLAAGQKKVFYAEKDERLDGLIFEILAEFESGLVNLADRRNGTGLKTAKFNPAGTSLIVLMSRSQVKASHSRLFEYVKLSRSIMDKV